MVAQTISSAIALKTIEEVVTTIPIAITMAKISIEAIEKELKTLVL